MMPTKTRELTPITEAKKDDRSCVICHPKSGRVREDQVWERCPTNARHQTHRGGNVTTGP